MIIEYPVDIFIVEVFPRSVFFNEIQSTKADGKVQMAGQSKLAKNNNEENQKEEAFEKRGNWNFQFKTF